MPTQERHLAIDIGSTGIRVGEFEYPSSGGLILQEFSHVEFSEQLSEANRTEIISNGLLKAFEEGNFTTRKASICVSGQAAFMRFVNLPPVSEEESRIKQIVEYEAKQNVPFPMDEVIWDYQLISGADEELGVMFVVIKNEIVESVIDAVVQNGLKPTLVDFAPSALYNVARASHIGENECCMVLNIGGRCTTLLFLDGQRFFARTIPIGGFSITQQVTKEFGISISEAETLKRRHGFVALGGAYEEPESEVAATISKIVRNVMTRLHGEVNRSISVYRTQQKGNKPVHLYLSGGSSTMAFTDHFFSEKLRMEVSYLNPFKIVSLNKSLDIKRLEELAHLFPETIGVGLRSSLECPVEISLIPESLRKQQSFASRKPFIIASCIAWISILLVFVGVLSREASLFKATGLRKKAKVERLKGIQEKIQAYQNKHNKVLEKFETIEMVLEQRDSWNEFLNALQIAMPQDTWLVRISAADSPSGTSKRKPNKRKGKNPFAKKKRSTKSQKKNQGSVVWFQLTGQAVTIPSKEPLREIFTPEQVSKFNEWVKATKVGEGKEPSTDTTTETSSTKKENYFWEPNVIKPDIILSELFLNSLQSLELFSEDPSETRILESRFSEKYRNLTTFRIQLKLIEPIGIKL